MTNGETKVLLLVVNGKYRNILSKEDNNGKNVVHEQYSIFIYKKMGSITQNGDNNGEVFFFGFNFAKVLPIFGLFVYQKELTCYHYEKFKYDYVCSIEKIVDF